MRKVKILMPNKKEIAPHIYGNYEDKYNAENPIAKFLMGNFIEQFKKNLSSLGSEKIDSICEVGCAEGELLKIAHCIYPDAVIFASDISEQEISKAKKNCDSFPVEFSLQNAENLEKYEDSAFDFLICCEVLEHLSNPEKGLQELLRISKKYILLSVPNEPVWRILNMARGKYLKDFGNTPGHINHWTLWQFSDFVNTPAKYSIMKRSYPFPWQMALLEKKRCPKRVFKTLRSKP